MNSSGMLQRFWRKIIGDYRLFVAPWPDEYRSIERWNRFNFRKRLNDLKRFCEANNPPYFIQVCDINNGKTLFFRLRDYPRSPRKQKKIVDVPPCV